MRGSYATGMAERSTGTAESVRRGPAGAVRPYRLSRVARRCAADDESALGALTALLREAEVPERGRRRGPHVRGALARGLGGVPLACGDDDALQLVDDLVRPAGLAHRRRPELSHPGLASLDDDLQGSARGALEEHG